MAIISAIAAIGKNRELGKGNELLWHIPDDLKRFKLLTSGHPVIMGRKTFESIFARLGQPLPNRTNIVLSRDPMWDREDVIVVHSMESAIEKGKKLDEKEIFIMGGAEIYQAALPFTDRLRLTLIEDEMEADSFFPEYKNIFITEVFKETREWNGLRYTWVDLER